MFPSSKCLVRMAVILAAQMLHHLCRATLVALHCVAFFALRFRTRLGGGAVSHLNFALFRS